MEHGNVTTVKYKDGVVYCNVRAIRVNNEYEEVPVLRSHSGFIQVPKQGETVTMEQLADGTRFITNVISRRSESPDDMKEGELTIQLDSETQVRFKESGNGYDLHLGASGKVFINGTAFSEHVHPYTDDEIADTSDGSGSETVQNKETDVPK